MPIVCPPYTQKPQKNAMAIASKLDGNHQLPGGTATPSRTARTSSVKQTISAVRTRRS